VETDDENENAKNAIHKTSGDFDEDASHKSNERLVNNVVPSEITVKEEDADEANIATSYGFNDPVHFVQEKVRDGEDLKPKSNSTIFVSSMAGGVAEESKNTVYCPYCYISVQSNSELEEHARSAHAVHTLSKLGFIFKCPHLYCQKKLMSIADLKVHQRNIHKLKDL
jgi:hypothetical protein